MNFGFYRKSVVLGHSIVIIRGITAQNNYLFSLLPYEQFMCIRKTTHTRLAYNSGASVCILLKILSFILQKMVTLFEAMTKKYICTFWCFLYAWFDFKTKHINTAPQAVNELQVKQFGHQQGVCPSNLPTLHVQVWIMNKLQLELRKKVLLNYWLK